MAVGNSGNLCGRSSYPRNENKIVDPDYRPCARKRHDDTWRTRQQRKDLRLLGTNVRRNVLSVICLTIEGSRSVGGRFHCNPDNATSVRIGQSQKLEPRLSHPQPRLLLDRIRYLFCTFSRVFEVGAVSNSAEHHGLH